MYLGDGCISTGPRTTRLRISLDAKYPEIIADCRSLLQRVFPTNSVDLVPFHKGNAFNVSVYHRHLPCLLPQHGPGLKHSRPLVPELWQWALLMAAPWPFIRGCIRTDGCAFTNRTDICQILSLVLNHVGVAHRLTNGSKRGLHQIRINRRDDVALMLKHVGLKT